MENNIYLFFLGAFILMCFGAIDYFKKWYVVKPRFCYVLSLILLFSILISSVQADPSENSFNLLNDCNFGTFNIGQSQGNVTGDYDADLGKDILKFDYSVSKGTMIGIWTKDFSSKSGFDVADEIKLDVKVLNFEQINQVSIKVEVKGTKGIQSIPLNLQNGWNSFKELINWKRIGNLNEIVFVLSPIGNLEVVTGALYFNIDFNVFPIQAVDPDVPVVEMAALKKVVIQESITQKSVKQESVNLAPQGYMDPSFDIEIPSKEIVKKIPASFNLLDASAQGVFNIGEAKGHISRSFDKELEKDVLILKYSAPKGTIVGVWTKSFPMELNVKSVDAAQVGINLSDYERQVSVKMEIKGTSSVQNIDFYDLKKGWNFIKEPIDWNLIGDLNEIVFVVTPIGASEMTQGTLFFDIAFEKLSFFQKRIVSPGGKVKLIFFMSLFFAFIAGFLRKRFCNSYSENQMNQKTDENSSKIKWDFLYGISAVLIVGISFLIYFIGTISCLDAGFGFLFLGLTGVIIAELLKFKLTGKHLTGFEVFQNILLTGLLAATSSRQVLLQAPASWTQVFLLSNLIAGLACLIYHGLNAYSLASKGKHLRFIIGSLIIGTPYLFGLLLMLENASLVQVFGNKLTLGLFNAWPVMLDIMGRFILVFAFNEAVANGISLASKGKLLKTSKAHLYILLVSLGVVLCPLIANLGSTPAIASLPVMFGAVAAILTTILSQAGLWAEVYFITGMILDGTRGIAPCKNSISGNITLGAKKGMMYSGIFMAIVYGVHMILDVPGAQSLMNTLPIVIGILAGALIFPLIKTIIETFDGSHSFLARVKYSYKKPSLYARGAVAGFGVAYGITHGLFQQELSDRILFGLIFGLVASVGVSLVRDIVNKYKNQGRIQSWKVYFVDALLGGFIGSAVAFYLDSSQVPAVIDKFKLYRSAGSSAEPYTIYPLLSKWGRVDLGTYTGGVKLLFNEALAGVINWSVAAWLFAINRTFMQAFFQKDKTPIKFFFSKAGFVELNNHMIHVLRWGLWMSPIINTFLRMMADPTWYNQDGAVRTVFAIYHNLTMSTGEFQAWSLKVFISLLAYDFFRILIWIDHMGLRVATLVNLSFLGMDKLDEKIARFIGKSSTQRYIPEAVKRFTTWGPLLIPFYIPRGRAWDHAWSTSQAIQNSAAKGGVIGFLQSLDFSQILFLVIGAVFLCTGISYVARLLVRRSSDKYEKVFELQNREYKVTVRENGGGNSKVLSNECDVSRPSYDTIDPCGRVLYMVDASEKIDSSGRSWPILGNFPKHKFEASHIKENGEGLNIINNNNGIKTTLNISLPDQDTTVEIWEITVENLTDKKRQIKVVPYLEWLLSKSADDRFHTQYARLFPEMQYIKDVNAILTWQKNTKSMGILACDYIPEGFLTSRMDFIGRARSIWSPRVLETLDFLEHKDIDPCPTFDPIGSLLVNVNVDANDSKKIKFMIGSVKNKEKAIELIDRYLEPKIKKEMTFLEKDSKSNDDLHFETAKVTTSINERRKSVLIGHGEIIPGTPQPYYKYTDNGNKIKVLTPYTTRPYDHAMSNRHEQFVMVTNRGLHTSSSGNSQQNRITPDGPDTVTREIPGEAIYLYDVDNNNWFSPTHHPLNDYEAKNEVEFGVDGTAVFNMTKGDLSTELTVFVPLEDTTGVYKLKIKNNSNKPKTMRVSPYFQIVLAGQPEWAGPLKVDYDKVLDALFFENPRNSFRKGPAFASMSIASEHYETNRGKFFGKGRGSDQPFMVESGMSDNTNVSDDRPVASFTGTIEVPANGESSVVVLLGQADSKKQAAGIIKKYKSIEKTEEILKENKEWWLGLMKTAKIETNDQDFDYLQNWLKYQALAERIWARRGFYQTSGAFGFRDQLQDTVNLIWIDPALARKQIILHASQQFIEGDVVHWFHTLHDGRTGFSNRSHASDNLLWLVWGVVEYINATGDDSILDEMTSYLKSDIPFQPLPKNKHGWGAIYHRSNREDSVYRHCLKSIDLVFEKRMGVNGLPLIGTGDWNDGLDEIGSDGKGESVWLGFFLTYILKNLINIIEEKDGIERKEHYLYKMGQLENALEGTWREDRYLRAIHDDGTEIGIKDSGVWEIDALTAAWAVKADINIERAITVFQTALNVLERDNVVLLGWPALREDTKPYLGRSSKYPEGVRENGMYCHGVQWLVKASRLLAERFERQGDFSKADECRATGYRLWLKITPIAHVVPEEIEIYGGQPNKQPADILTTYDVGRMIWNGYTGAAAWLLRQAFEGVVGAKLVNNKMILPDDLDKPRGKLKIKSVHRDVGSSPYKSVRFQYASIEKVELV